MGMGRTSYMQGPRAETARLLQAVSGQAKDAWDQPGRRTVGGIPTGPHALSL